MSDPQPLAVSFSDGSDGSSDSDDSDDSDNKVKEPLPVDNANPYVGPQTFQEEDRGRFFGRESEGEELLGLILRERLVLFYAQSGAGKSSLINAWLIPRLRDAGFVPLPVARVSGSIPATIDPDAVKNIFAFNVIASINEKLPPAESLAVDELPGLTLADFLAGAEAGDAGDLGDESLSASDSELDTEPDSLQPYILFIDQFEEIVTTHLERWQERRVFFMQLREAMVHAPNLWVVLTLREDYVAPLDLYADLLLNRLRARYYMQRLGVDAALRAIKLPAEEKKRPFTPRAARTLVDNLRQVRAPGQDQPIQDQYVEPVQLQVVCHQLWEKITADAARTVPDTITESDLPLEYVDEALTNFYENALESVLLDEVCKAEGVTERNLREWFSSQLVTQAGTRGFLFRDEATGFTGSMPNTVVDLLNRRFLLRSEPRAGGEWVELVHDRFVSPILKSNDAWSARNQNPIMRAARAWQDKGLDPKLLYDGQALYDAQDELERTPAKFGDLEKDFIAASAKHEKEQGIQRRQRVIGIASLVVILLLLSIWAITSNFQALTAAERAIQAQKEAQAAKVELERLTRPIRADQLTANSLNVFNENPALAYLLAAEGLRIQHNITETQTLTRVVYNVEQAQYVTETQVITGSEPIVASARNNVYDLLSRPMGRALTGHTGSVRAIAFNTDGSRLSTGSSDDTVRLWDMNDLSALPVVIEHRNNLYSAIAFSPDGSRLATTGTEDYTVRIWDVTNDSELHTLEGHTSSVTAIAFSLDGQWLAAGADDYTVRIWDVANETELHTLSGYTSSIRAVAFSPDSSQLAIGTDDGIVRIWDIASETELHRLEGHIDWIRAVAFSPDGSQLATVSDDRTVRLWDVAKGDLLHIMEGHTNWVHAVAFSPDGSRLATGADDRTVRIWDVASGVNLYTIQGHTGSVRAVAFAPDGKQLVTGSDDYTVHIWDVHDLSAQIMMIKAQTEPVTAIAFSPGGSLLAAGTDDSSVRLWETDDGTAQPVLLQGHTSSVRAVAFSPDGSRLASGAADYTVRLWDVARTLEPDTLEPDTLELDTLEGHTNWVNAVAFSPDGSRLVSGSDDNTVRLWDVASGAELYTLEGHTSWVNAVAFSPDGQWLASGAGDNSVRLWDVDTGMELAALQGHTNVVNAIAFSPNGAWLASGSSDNSIRIWDPYSLPTRPIELQGHTGGVNAVAFSTDGRWLATGSDDRSIRVWDFYNLSASPVIIRGHDDAVKAVAFSPDGNWLASGSSDRSARLWPWSAEDLLQFFCSISRRNLSSSEWNAYFPAMSYRTTCSQWPVHGSVVQSVIDEGRVLARDGNLDDAVVKFEEALQLDAALEIDPMLEAQRAFAEGSLDEGRRLAGEGDLRGAIAKFEAALQMDETLDIDPVVEAHNAYVAEPLEEGRALAQQGELDKAAAQFEEAVRRDASLEIDPVIEAGRLYAPVLMEKGRELAQQGDLEGAIAKFEEAVRLDERLGIKPQAEAGRLIAPLLVEEGRALAQRGDLEGAIAKFEEAVRLDESLEIQPQAEAGRLVAPLLVEEGRALAQQGNLEGAIAKFEEAVRLDESLEIQPQAEAGRLVAPLLVEEGRNLAWQGDLEGAIAKFEEAVRLDENLEIQPQAEAGRLVAPLLVEEGRNLAWQGDLEEAIAKFEEALRLNESLEIEPVDEAGRLYASALVNEGRNLAQQGDLEEAIAKFEEAVRLDESLEIEPEAEAQQLAIPVLIELVRTLATAQAWNAAQETLAGVLAAAVALDDPVYNMQLCGLQSISELADQVEPACAAWRTGAWILNAGGVVTGTVRANSGDLWRFDGQADQVVTITMEDDNSGLDTYLTLYDMVGSVVASNDDFGGTNSRIDALPLAADETYFLLAHGYGGSAGDYRLELIVEDGVADDEE